MTIYEYVKEYNYTFKERPFNEVDNLVLASLAYPNYIGIISNNSNERKRLGLVAKEYFEKNPKIIKGEIVAIRVGVKLLELIKESRRFKNILVYNYVYEGNESSQFSAVTFDLGDNLYIAYEGTDALISGWEEDFEMSYRFPVEAHKKAIKYLNRYTFSKKKLIIGGHSKGGNLALVASMCTNFLVRGKIINIYSNDGQGLRKSEINSKKYNRIKSRFIHIIPHTSIVGLLFRHKNDTVIKASPIPLVSHASSNWQIAGDEFVRCNLSKTSKAFDNGFQKWLDKYDDEKRKRFVTNIFDILRENNITTLIQIKTDFSNVIKIARSSKIITSETKEMLNDLIKIINEANKEYISK